MIVQIHGIIEFYNLDMSIFSSDQIRSEQPLIPVGKLNCIYVATHVAVSFMLRSP